MHLLLPELWTEWGQHCKQEKNEFCVTWVRGQTLAPPGGIRMPSGLQSPANTLPFISSRLWVGAHSGRQEE